VKSIFPQEAIVKSNQWQLFNTAAASGSGNNWGQKKELIEKYIKGKAWV
jgi:hypothetical protein